jgi:hypothetical protein
LLLLVKANDQVDTSEVGDLTPDFRSNIQTFATTYDIERRTLQTYNNISPHNHQSLDKQSTLNQTKSPPNHSKMAADAKTEVMQQVRQQAALQNARFLVDVSTAIANQHQRPDPNQSAPGKIISQKLLLTPHFPLTESQRALLRARNPQPRLVHLFRRADQFHQLHGEVHGRVEHY